MQEIEAHSGIKVRGHCHATLSSAKEYFYNVAKQDMEQLHEQPNSVDDEEDARAKYNFRHQFNAVLPRFISDEYNQTGFRLICDDFRYGNMIVNNASDLRIAAVIDWEWAYTAPYQMFSSAPRWLLIRNPILWEAPDGVQFQRYMACLELFLSELEMEESRRTKGDIWLSNLMRKSLNDGRFWFHELVYGCFTAADNPAWKAICDMFPDISNLATPPQPELDAFVRKKMKQLDVYRAEWNAIRKDGDLARAE